MKRTLEDIRENLEWVGCDNETVLELCAEVERLNSVVAKLTRDCVRYSGELLARANEMKGEIDRLRAIVHRLPKTADGVPIALGDDLWSNDSRGTFEWCVTEIHTHDVCGKFHGAPCVFEQYGNCYSTREAAEKARKP